MQGGGRRWFGHDQTLHMSLLQVGDGFVPVFLPKLFQCVASGSFRPLGKTGEFTRGQISGNRCGDSARFGSRRPDFLSRLFLGVLFQCRPIFLHEFGGTRQSRERHSFASTASEIMPSHPVTIHEAMDEFEFDVGHDASSQGLVDSTMRSSPSLFTITTIWPSGLILTWATSRPALRTALTARVTSDSLKGRGARDIQQLPGGVGGRSIPSRADPVTVRA